VNRRAFIAALGSAAVWPLVARAQQPAMPVVGYLAVGAGDSDSRLFDAFRRGLSETGFVDGTDVSIEQRVGDGRADQLPAFAADATTHCGPGGERSTALNGDGKGVCGS
jgi:putative ABC transport system substrate-binding protein